MWSLLTTLFMLWVTGSPAPLPAEFVIRPSRIFERVETPAYSIRATDAGLLLINKASGRRRVLNRKTGLPDNVVTSVQLHRGQAYFVVKGGGLWRHDISSSKTVALFYKPGHPLNWLSSFEARGTPIYLGGVKSGLHKLVDGKPVVITRIRRQWTLRGMLRIGRYLYLGTDGGRLYRLKNETRLARLRSALYPLKLVRKSGAIEVSSMFKRCLLRLDGTTIRCALHLPADLKRGDPNHITALASFGGQTYVATFDNGLYRMANGQFKRVMPQITFINALYATPRALYIGSLNGLHILYSDGRSDRIERQDGLTGNKINAITSDGNELLLSLSSGFCRLDPEKRRARCLKRSELPGQGIAHLAIAHRGSDYILTNKGLVRISKSGKQLYDMASHGLPQNWVTGAHFSGRTLLIGTYSGGVVRFTIDENGAPKSDKSLSSSLWVNPNGIRQIGATRYILTLNDGVHQLRDGRLSKLDVSLPSRDITAILQVGKKLLIGTRSGLAIISPRAESRLDILGRNANRFAAALGTDPGVTHP